MGRPGERMAWYLNSPPRDRAKKPESPAERSRRERWKFPIAARVVHPTRGTVVVPCRSKLAALIIVFLANFKSSHFPNLRERILRKNRRSGTNKATNRARENRNFILKTSY